MRINFVIAALFVVGSTAIGVTKVEPDASWKKTGVEDKALRIVAFQGFDNPDMAKMWIARGANVDGTENDLETPLHKTTNKDSALVAAVLIENGANVNAVDRQGRTPLALAKIKGSGKVAALLIKNGGKVAADPKKTPTKKPVEKPIEKPVKRPEEKPVEKPEQTIDEMIYDLASNGGDDDEQVKGLIKIGAKVNIQPGPQLETPLHRTIYKDNVRIAKALIDNKADLNALDCGGRTPLLNACIHGSSKVAKLLIQRGANVNIGDTMQNSPLHHAIRMGHTTIARLLIQNRAQINAKNCFNETPLHLIYHLNEPNFVTFLLIKGANIADRDDQQRNARDLLKSFGKQPIDFATDSMLEEAELKELAKQ